MNEGENRQAEEMSAHTGPSGLTTGELLQQITEDAKHLVQMEVELARQEAHSDLHSEIDMAKGAVVAAVTCLLGLNMLIVAAVLGMAPSYAWIAALVVGVILLIVAAVAAYVAWQFGKITPMGTTRQTLKEDLQWAKRQVK